MKMSVFKSVFGIVLVMLTVVAMMDAACGPQETAPPPLPPTPSGNQPPVIFDLVADSMQVYPSGNTEIKCTAQDADGDQINFKWACTGGEFSGAGPIVMWKAPPAYGTYTITVTVEDGKGGSAQGSLDIIVGANQAPLISSLAANPSGVLYGGTTTITCIATDPDGDSISYDWSASEGDISGVGNKVTWLAPEKGGDFNVTVIVTDGKGGETTGNVMVSVAAASRTVTIRPIAQETGSARSDGTTDSSRTLAGDDDKDRGYCAFWSFDVWSLQKKKIQHASLKFPNPMIAGNPFAGTGGLNGLRFWRVKYGDAVPAFKYTGSNIINVAVQTTPPTELDITQEIVNVVAGAATRFQVEALFLKDTNGNKKAEFIEWPEGVVLEVTYSDY
jgi:hypothetical protein